MKDTGAGRTAATGRVAGACHNSADLGKMGHWDLQLQMESALDTGMPVRPAAGVEKNHSGERRVLVMKIVVVVAVALQFAA